MAGAPRSTSNMERSWAEVALPVTQGRLEVAGEDWVEGFRDGSGLFGVAGHASSGALTSRALGALQHRGGLGFALAVSDGQDMRSVRGWAEQALPAPGAGDLSGTLALGQVFGGLGSRDFGGLPLDGGDRMVVGHWDNSCGAVAIAGRFTNGTRIRRELKEKGALFQTESDAEVLLHLIAQSSQRTPVNRIVDALWKVEGAFSALILGPNLLVAVRDPRGFRPLVVGRFEGALLVATEDTAIRDIGGEVRRPIAPGEMLVVDRGGVQSVRPFPPQPLSGCSQELGGLARHDATVFGRSAYAFRGELGSRLGEYCPVSDAEVVVALPDDEPFAIGFARRCGVAYERGFIVRLCLDQGRWDGPVPWNVVPSVVRGRRVVLVARSLLTGKILKRVVASLFEAGAVDVHVRIACPPIRKACLYGVPSPTTDELVWNHRQDTDELALWLDCRSVAFLSTESYTRSLGEGGWCTACLSGEQPVVPEEPDDQLPLF